MFDGVEVRAVCRKIFERMPCAGEGVLGVLSFVAGGVVHHHHASYGQLGQEILLDPGGEDIGIDSDAEQSDHKQATANQRAAHIGTASSVPVVCAVTSLPWERIAMGARHVVCAAAFVDINNAFSRRFVCGELILADAPCVRVRFGMCQSFL